MLTLFHLTLIAALAALVFVVQRLSLSLRHAKARKEAGCLPAAHYPHKEPFLGLDLFRAWFRAEGSGHASKFFKGLHEQYGRTFEMKMCSATEIHTIEPQNLQALCATQFEDFGFAPVRRDIGPPFIGKGFVIEDGEIWSQSRAIMKPGFKKAEVGDLPAFEKHVERFIKLIPEGGATFDVQALADRLFLDSITEFLFGESLECLLPETPFDSTEFLASFERVLLNLGLRMLTGPLSPLLSLDPGFKPAYTVVHKFIDRKVEQCLERRKAGDEKPQTGKFILLDSMAEYVQDPYQLRNDMLGIFMASRGNSGPSASNTFWYLAQHPQWWKALREEACALEEPFTFEKMKAMRVAKAIINEVFRLRSPVPKTRKAALRDTTFPVGGGPDGKSPMFVPKGRVVDINFYALHRDRETWGDDVDEFNPQRWLVKLEDRPMWESKWQYAPFFGGKRMCMAQNQVLVQVTYLLARVAREFVRCEFRDEVKVYEEVTRIAINNRRGVKIALFKD